MKKAILFAFALLLFTGLGFALGFSVRKQKGPDWSAELFGGGLPGQFATQGGPLIEDLRAGQFRLAIASYGLPLRMLGHRNLQGHFNLGVFDRDGKPVYAMTNGEANEECRVDYSDFVAHSMIKFVYHTWDCRQVKRAPWKIEVLVFRPEGPPDSSIRIALQPAPGDTVQIDRLANQAKKSFELSRKSRGTPESDKAFRLGERSLNQLRNIGVGRPDEVITCFKAMKWADGAIAEAIAGYLAELEEVKRARK